MHNEIYPVGRNGFDVELDTLIFHATSWRITAVRRYAEQNTLGGSVYITNSGLRARRLELEGSFCFNDDPAAVLLLLDNAIATNKRFAFSLRGVRYIAAILTEYSLSEQAADSVLPCRLVLVISNLLTAAPVEEAAP